MLHDMGIDTGIDLDALIEAARAGGGDRRPGAAVRRAAGRPAYPAGDNLTFPYCRICPLCRSLETTVGQRVYLI